ncbi:MAG: hypothetical protein OXT68_10705 [Chloroflexota bacterium]|nr:hypothetical protein [Chloroflexota bacterium]
MAVEGERPRRPSPAMRLGAWILLTIAMTACGALQPLEIRKIALLAPFEGQYRALGYNALYAMGLALSEADLDNVQLLPVDDGGDVSSASSRIRALNLDSAVVAIIALGEAATHPATQQANDKALILIGNWGHERADEDSLYATDRGRAESSARDDLLIARQMIRGGGSPQDIFRSNGALADARFSARYADGGQEIPRPNWLATLTYDLARLALASIADGSELSDIALDGLNGKISFADGYWQEAPIHRYQFLGGELAPLSA